MNITVSSHPALAETLSYCLNRGQALSPRGLDIEVTEDEASYLETALQKLTISERQTFADGDEAETTALAQAYDLEPANDLLNRIFDNYFYPPRPQPGAFGNQLD